MDIGQQLIFLSTFLLWMVMLKRVIEYHIIPASQTQGFDDVICAEVGEDQVGETAHGLECHKSAVCYMNNHHCPHPDGGDDVAGRHDLGLAAAPGVHTEPEQEQVQVLETREVLTTVNMQWSITH